MVCSKIQPERHLVLAIKAGSETIDAGISAREGRPFVSDSVPVTHGRPRLVVAPRQLREKLLSSTGPITRIACISVPASDQGYDRGSLFGALIVMGSRFTRASDPLVPLWS